MANKNPKAKEVRGVSMRPARWERLKRIAGEERLMGGVSAIVDDAVTLWLMEYDGFDIKSEWVTKRQIPVQKPEADDEV